MARPKLVELPDHRSKPPHKCLVTGRTDSPLVDFGVDYTGIDPHIYIRDEVVEEAAKQLLGMVPAAEVEALQEQLEEAEAVAARVTEIAASAESLLEAAQRIVDLFAADATEDETAGDGADPQEA